MTPDSDLASRPTRLPPLPAAVETGKATQPVDWDAIGEQRELTKEVIEAAKKVFADRADVLRRLS
ncbi:hypothetical protein AYO47_03705 [Planctomyces sp. SCGC AG-212-M04]|nr:hypothetical protein AYO47_03705 [Planctomyces sp. SCGC AG-212-M04]